MSYCSRQALTVLNHSHREKQVQGGWGGRKKNNPKHIPNHINQAENRDSTIIIPSPRTLLALPRSEWLVRQVCLDEAVLKQSSSPVEVSLVDTPLVKDLEL